MAVVDVSGMWDFSKPEVSELRAQEKYLEALDIQLRLEREWDAGGEADPYVHEELEQIYRALGDEERAKHQAARLAAARSK